MLKLRISFVFACKDFIVSKFYVPKALALGTVTNFALDSNQISQGDVSLASVFVGRDTDNFDESVVTVRAGS
jgi:hypothetical protein